jgi:hypothetical protein
MRNQGQGTGLAGRWVIDTCVAHHGQRRPLVARRRSRWRLLAGGLSAASILAFAVPAADATVGSREILSGSLLPTISLGNELSCQVAYGADDLFEMFPPLDKPGDCGTLLAPTGGALYAPNFAAHAATATGPIGSYTAFTPVSQSAVSGAGTVANPYKVTTIAYALPANIRITQVDSYVAPQDLYRTDITIQNLNSFAVGGVLYRAGDCYLDNYDYGYGLVSAVGPMPKVGCAEQPGNIPPGRFEEWISLTPGNRFMQGSSPSVWQRIGTHLDLPNTHSAFALTENGAAISWSYTLARGERKTYSHQTVIDPPPDAPQRPALPAAPKAAFGAAGLVDAPSNSKGCIDRRYLRVTLRQRYRRIIATATLSTPKSSGQLIKPSWAGIVDIHGMPHRRFRVAVTARTVTGETIQGTRVYQRCSGPLRGGRPKL